MQLRLTYERPDVPARAAIWRRMLPSEAPLAGDIDAIRLARGFDLSGGQIRNAMLAAALDAASAKIGERRITHTMLERAARVQVAPAAGVTVLRAEPAC